MGLVAESPSAVSCCPVWAFWWCLPTAWRWKGREWSQALWVFSEFLRALSSQWLGASSRRAESQEPVKAHRRLSCWSRWLCRELAPARYRLWRRATAGCQSPVKETVSRGYKKRWNPGCVHHRRRVSRWLTTAVDDRLSWGGGRHPF